MVRFIGASTMLAGFMMVTWDLYSMIGTEAPPSAMFAIGGLCLLIGARWLQGPGEEVV